MQKSPFPLKSHLHVLIHSGSGVPYALRLNVRKLSWVVALVATAFLLTLAGTLLFFRELELNRKLEERLLEWETRDKLAQVMGTPRVPAKEIVEDATPAKAAAPEAKPVTPSATVGARIGELNAECSAGDCDVRLAMVPIST